MMKQRKQYDVIDLNVSTYSILPENKILIAEKTQFQNEYNLIEYDVETKEITTLAKVKSDKIYYDKDKNLVYVNLAVPSENEKQEIIYTADVSKLASVEP